jgi:hypothetical protein
MVAKLIGQNHCADGAGPRELGPPSQCTQCGDARPVAEASRVRVRRSLLMGMVALPR